jgi:hypothetical protein
MDTVNKIIIYILLVSILGISIYAAFFRKKDSFKKLNRLHMKNDINNRLKNNKHKMTKIYDDLIKKASNEQFISEKQLIDDLGVCDGACASHCTIIAQDYCKENDYCPGELLSCDTCQKVAAKECYDICKDGYCPP